MARIGYGRVSTRDQHPEVQEDALKAAGCEPIFTDHGVSGKLARRPQLDAALAFLRPGDTLVITKLDRLGRSVRNLIEQVADLGGRQVDLVVLHQGLDTTTPAGKMMFHILAAVAEFERDLTVERTMDGLAAARERGRTGGRPVKMTPEKTAIARQMYDSKVQDETRRGVFHSRYTAGQIAKVLGVSESAVRRALARDAGDAAAA